MGNRPTTARDGRELTAALMARFGTLPPFLGRPSSDAAAYAQHVETGLRLNTVAEVPRFRRLARN
jgi:hypothetical protein